jgi:thiamine-monophosphate kinase
MKSGRQRDSGEDRLIARYFKPLARHPGAFGLLDDAALLKPRSGEDLVLTTDAIVGSVHFFADDPAGAIAKKALRVNLSDLAAKGARPLGFLLTLALPKRLPGHWLKAFAAGLEADAQAYECPLLGGDTVLTPGPLMVSITALGSLPRGSMVRRGTALVGDHVLVTGTIGDAALGLRLRKGPAAVRRWKLSAAERAYLLQRYLIPEPRSAVAFAIRKYATGAMDVSDGLAGDLAKLCRVSGVAAVVESERVPLSAAARTAVRADGGLRKTLFSAGDDYEIVCTVRPARLASFVAAARAVRVPVADIGRIVRGDGVVFGQPNGRAMTFARGSFSHF